MKKLAEELMRAANSRIEYLKRDKENRRHLQNEPVNWARVHAYDVTMSKSMIDGEAGIVIHICKASPDAQALAEDVVLSITNDVRIPDKFYVTAKCEW